MGALSSKATGSHLSLVHLSDKTTKRSIIFRVEPLIPNFKNKSIDNRKREGSNKNKIKNNISKPSEFMHLNHAGIDYNSLDLTFIPIEQAQVAFKRTSKVGYTADHYDHPILRHLGDGINESNCYLNNVKSNERPVNRHSSYSDVFSKEKYNASHNINKTKPGSRIGVS